MLASLGERLPSRTQGSHITRLAIAALLGIATMQVLAADEVQSAAPVPKHLELARELVATVKPENNQYNLLGKGVRWKGDLFTSENVVDASCATFVSSLLEKAKAPALKQIESKTYWRSLLRVNNFIEGTERGLGMSKIANINDVEPGDLFMFVCLDNGGCIMSQGVGQGHITVVDVKPAKRASTPPIVSDTIQWTVTVIDAAERPHNRDDTRWTAQGEPKRTGVGRGSYRIYTNLEGVPVGYTTGFGPKYFDAVTRPITIGRVLPY